MNKAIFLLGVLFFLIFQQSISISQKSVYHADSVELLVPTFLGNEQRNYYGNVAPDSLNVIWKHYLGKGKTTISRNLGEREWAGAGWTGQPLLVKEKGELFLIQGAYDHHLKKINAETGKLVWQYKFDDVVKGTGTIWKSNNDTLEENRVAIFQGSRLGYGNYLDTKHIPSYRAISFFTGKELWRHDVKWTKSYSRDADGSALILDDTLYIALENSYFTLMNPDYRAARIKNGMLQPEIFQQTILYNSDDVASHKGNVVTESSPCLLNGVIYIASGAGHIWGYSLKEKKLVWDFFTGTDIDGSPVVTDDSCIIVTIERQYIEGKGGVFKLNPAKKPEESVIWYLPVENKEFNTWEGGIIGSAGINDAYHNGELPYLAAVNAIDGNMYVLEHTVIDTSVTVDGPNLKHKYHPPKLISKRKIGASISTPIFDGEKLITAGYGGLYMYKYSDKGLIRVAKFNGYFESTPVFYNKRLYIPSRNGYLYCLGN